MGHGFQTQGTECEDHVQLGPSLPGREDHLQLGSIEAYTRSILPEEAKVRPESTLSCRTGQTLEAASLV
jgi:hypothetical protein